MNKQGMSRRPLLAILTKKFRCGSCPAGAHEFLAHRCQTMLPTANLSANTCVIMPSSRPNSKRKRLTLTKSTPCIMTLKINSVTCLHTDLSSNRAGGRKKLSAYLIEVDEAPIFNYLERHVLAENLPEAKRLGASGPARDATNVSSFQPLNGNFCNEAD